MNATALAEAMEKEHAALGKELRRVLEATKAPSLRGPDMTACLESIRGHLLEHFRFEEEDGYMDAVVHAQPNMQRLVDRLLEEHRAMDATLQELISTARAHAELGEPFSARIHAWLDQMHRHEAEENKLVLISANQDVGTKD